MFSPPHLLSINIKSQRIILQNQTTESKYFETETLQQEPLPRQSNQADYFFFLLKMWVVFKYRKENMTACGDIFHQKDAALRAFGFQIPTPTGVASSVVEDNA